MSLLACEHGPLVISSIAEVDKALLAVRSHSSALFGWLDTKADRPARKSDDALSQGYVMDVYSCSWIASI